MLRHGLVHESPGYVCPFCPNKKHKYPRPDNLQRQVIYSFLVVHSSLTLNRHVNVHHVDKDKNDARLRDVLSQGPEGPRRGRRRKYGTS